MREIDAEEDKNDWVRAVVDVPGVGDGVVDRLAELNLPVMPYNGGKAPIDKESGSSTLERRNTGHCASGSNRRDRHRPG